MKKINLRTNAPRVGLGGLLAVVCLLAAHSASTTAAVSQQRPISLVEAAFDGSCPDGLRVVVKNTGAQNMDTKVCAQTTDGQWMCEEFTDMDRGQKKGILVCNTNGSYKFYSRHPGDSDGEESWLLEAEGTKERGQ